MCLVFQGLVDHITSVLSSKKDSSLEAELTRVEVVKCIQHQRVRFRGLNLSGVDLSKLVSSQICQLYFLSFFFIDILCVSL